MNLTILSQPEPGEDPAADRDTPRRFGWIAAILCFCFFFMAGSLSISQSKSSTAAIGYIFLPFYAAVISLFSFLAGWCAGYFLVWCRSPAKTGRLSAFAAAIVPVILLVAGGWGFITLSHQRDRLTTMRLAAKDPNTPTEALQKLAVSSNEYVLGDLAGNPKVPEATLRRLVKQGGYLIELGLAHNSSAPADILTRLATSQDEYTRGYVAGNPNAPAEALDALSRDLAKNVRISLAQNPSTPRSTLETLLGDGDETVRRLANARMRRH
jgi:hypothetical protein